MARQDLGEYRLVQELQLHDDRFQVYFRLSKEQFDSLLPPFSPIGRAEVSSQRGAVKLKHFQFGHRQAPRTARRRRGRRPLARRSAQRQSGPLLRRGKTYTMNGIVGSGLRFARSM